MDPDTYLERIGVDPATVGRCDRQTLARLQEAHLRSVPFETITITGLPGSADDGGVPSLRISDLYEKIVENRRGGFCFELNGLFTTLLEALGYDAERLEARVIDSEGDSRPPANHHTIAVTLDDRYLVDVGLGTPKLREPLPFDGSVVTDATTTKWRLAESERPDAAYVVRAIEPDESTWSDRYLVREGARSLQYFDATCEYLSTAPESVFTGEPTVSIATETGHKRLSGDTLSIVRRGHTDRESVPTDQWPSVLESEFGVPPESL